MSRSELLDAYLEGRLGRREFIQGLVGSGIALGAAAAHAAALKPAVMAAGGDFYGPAVPTSKDQCMNGGFAAFGFRNQGQCIRFVNTGK